MLHGRTEVVIYPKRTEWVESNTGQLLAPPPALDQDRVWVESEADIDRWIRDVGLTLSINGCVNYWLAIEADKGYAHYDMPVPEHHRDYTGIAKAVWSVVDLHIAFGLGQP